MGPPVGLCEVAPDDFGFATSYFQACFRKVGRGDADQEGGGFVWDPELIEPMGDPVLMESVPLRRKPLAMRFRHRFTETTSHTAGCDRVPAAQRVKQDPRHVQEALRAPPRAHDHRNIEPKSPRKGNKG